MRGLILAAILHCLVLNSADAQWFRGKRIIEVDVDSVLVLTEVDDVPYVPGGYQRLADYISLVGIYPKICQLQNITGTVKVAFEVNADGYTTNVNVVNSANPLLDREAKRIVSSLPRLGAATYKGLHVPVDMTLQINFGLDGKWYDVEKVDLQPYYLTVQYFDSANVELHRPDYQRAIELYTTSIEYDPEHYLAYYERGICHYSLHDIDKAEADFAEALRLTDGRMVDAYMTRGYMRMEFDRMDSAIVDFMKVLDRYNTSYSVHLALGKCWLDKNELKLSRKYLRLANVYGPKFQEAFYYLGIVEMTRKEYEAAVSAFGKAIELVPDHMDAFFNRGMANARLRNMKSACVDWIKAASYGHDQAKQLVQSQCNAQINE